MLQKFLLTGLGIASISTAFTQDSAKVAKFKWSASVDGYYRYNFSGSPTSPYNNFTSFTNSQNSFEIGMASIKAEHTIGKVGVVADLGFGKRAEEFSYNDTRTLQVIKQAFVTYAPSSHVKFTMGKWATHIGYELVDAAANRNYSMSYMFTNGPFFHTGIRTDVTFGKSGFMIGIANPTDYTTTSSSTKTLIAQFSTACSDDRWKAYLNYQGYSGAKRTMPGASSLNQVDVVVTGTVSSKLSIGYNGTIQSVEDEDIDKSKKWWGSALYLNYDPSSVFGLTWRNEYFSDQKYGVKLPGGGANIFASTLSGNIKLDNFRIIPELRIDNASKSIFTNSKGAASKGTASFLLAAVYSF